MEEEEEEKLLDVSVEIRMREAQAPKATGEIPPSFAPSSVVLTSWQPKGRTAITGGRRDLFISTHLEYIVARQVFHADVIAIDFFFNISP